MKAMKVDFLRLLRYGIGAYLLIGGLIQMDGIVILMGSVMTLMAIFNVGCFGGQCAPTIPTKQNTSGQEIEEVTFEEVK
ncbi:MAG: hypothetical protein NWS31_03305 [Crocinitomicaceae bacterium]|nr:hypothetical protein [Crocinitomicaceae bacterium]MDP4800214.1 hypothetical protein [Crocinitomicaceae bacterium]MDP4806729.1 hypothetical protein [Crocinitomicaceae bacterium]MDP4868120.1 hypothetical protein [Crocinitomicaceae bacterium]MDP4955975.1 hypothetical protein [Crocinitomicaceae bacterium]